MIMSSLENESVKKKIGLSIKRSFDIVISLIALIILLPLIVVIAIAIKFEDWGPILFIHKRVGKDGEIFNCYKFRSMVIGAENMGLGLKIKKKDSRITKVGRIIREWTLDEIPQLFNVLRGEMSIVGPRPVMPTQTENYLERENKRFDMKPGMAGWAWIHGRRELPWKKRIDLDIWYIDNWSLKLDLYILFRAAVLLFLRKGVNVTPNSRIESG